MLELIPYKTCPGSFALYLAEPTILAVQVQRTEFGRYVLDIEIEHSGESNTAHRGKFLLRMEGTRQEISVLGESIRIALQKPRLHPSPGDLFEAALIDRSGLPEPLREFYEQAAKDASKEVDQARASL